MDLLNDHALLSNLPFLRKISNRANCWLIWLNLKLWTRDTKLNRRHGLSSTTRFPVKRDAGSCKLSLPDLLLIPLGMKFVCQQRVHEVRRCSITPCYFPSRDPQSRILSALFPISAEFSLPYFQYQHQTSTWRSQKWAPILSIWRQQSYLSFSTNSCSMIKTTCCWRAVQVKLNWT